MIEIFLMLAAGHFIADYPLQTEAIALGKNVTIDRARFGVNWYYWMTSHAATHAAFVYVVTGSIGLGIAEFGAHFLIDHGKCKKLYNIHVDQIAHIVCKAVWAYLAVY